jgi:uncharacterized damage-inducible protein DinB
MSPVTQFRLFAHYNQTMNRKIYLASERLTRAEIEADRGAFFGSILGSLNHILVGDLIWLKRFAQHPSRHYALTFARETDTPYSLDQTLYENFVDLREHRNLVDEHIVAWCAQLSDDDLDYPLSYKTMGGEESTRTTGLLVSHFFNHQTHHRGQISTLLSQYSIDLGVTDLLQLIPQYE